MQAYPKNSGAKTPTARGFDGFGTTNAASLRCAAADYFLVANEQSASVLQTAGVAMRKIKVFGFPVSPKFADSRLHIPPRNSERRVLRDAARSIRGARNWRTASAELGVDLTVTAM